MRKTILGAITTIAVLASTAVPVFASVVQSSGSTSSSSVAAQSSSGSAQSTTSSTVVASPDQYVEAW